MVRLDDELKSLPNRGIIRTYSFVFTDSDPDYPHTASMQIRREPLQGKSGLTLRNKIWYTEVDDSTSEILKEGELECVIALNLPVGYGVLDPQQLLDFVANTFSLTFDGIDGSDRPNLSLMSLWQYDIPELDA
jgi:hypothetical protein